MLSWKVAECKPLAMGKFMNRYMAQAFERWHEAGPYTCPLFGLT